MRDRNFFSKIGHGIKEFGIGTLETAIDILFAGSFGGEDSAKLEQFHKNVKLGKSASRVDSRTLQLSKYIRPNALSAPPVSVNWTKKLSNLGMMLNDQLGDCTCAAAGHMEQTWTANSSTQFIPPDSSILTAYEAVGGYVSGQPNTDNGAVEIDVLNYWRQTGVAGRKILAYVSVNVQNEIEVQQAIALFGGVYIGLAMPAAWQQTQNWTTASGLVARFKKLFGDDWDPGSWGGHCLIPGTKVLTADLRWVPIENIEVGEVLIGFDEHIPDGKTRRYYSPSVVTQSSELELECYELEFSDGSKITASFDHLWLTCPNWSAAKWVSTENLKEGVTRVCKPIDPWPVENSWEAGYLAAAFDGEGWLTKTTENSKKRLHRIGFCQRNNEMLRTVEHCLSILGFGSRKGTQRKNGIGKQDCMYLALRGKQPMIRLLGQMRPQRLLSKFNPTLLSAMEAVNKPKLISKKSVGLKKVVALGTSTKTFIAEGFASHNCVPLVGYDTSSGQTKYTLITWGSDAYTITAPAMLEYCDECYAVISQDWLNAQGVTPAGLDLAQLQADLAQIT